MAAHTILPAPSREEAAALAAAVALLLEEEAARAKEAGDALPPAYRSRWRSAGMLTAVRPVEPPRAGRPLWQLVFS
jgi:hypothetical protein